MTYISKADAILKLTDGFFSNNSFSIYSSDTNYNLNTIFYSDSDKTTLLTTGKYVLPTNYRTLYLQIGSNGKMTAPPEFLITTTSDTSWVDDTIYSRQTQTREKHYRTDMMIVNNLLTDNAWDQVNFGIPNKQRVCGMGYRSTSAVTNIDLSDMAGFDLLFYSGPYSTLYNNQFISALGSTYFVHIKQNLDRTTVFTENSAQKIYFFKPDYWYAKQTINKSTFFNRNPYLPQIKNSRGGYKSLETFQNYVHDVLDIDKITSKTSTRKERGIGTENFPSPNSTSGLSGYANVPYTLEASKGIYFDQPASLVNFFPTVYGYTFSQTSLLDNVRLVATLRSMYYEDFTGSYTYYYAENGTLKSITVPYSQANPFQWTCDRNSGTGHNDVHWGTMVYQELGNSTIGINWHYDAEWFWLLTTDDGSIRGFFECIKRARDAYRLDNPTALDKKISWYGWGIYQNNTSWSSFNDTPNFYDWVYGDYHNYYTNNGSRSTLSPLYSPVWFDYAEVVSHSFLSNYLNGYNTTWYFHHMIHQYDISNKLFKEKLGNNHTIKLQSYMFQVYETISYVNMTSMLKGKSINGTEAAAKPDISPDFYQSLAAWSFGYADGTFLWEAPNGEWNFEDYQSYNVLVYNEETKQWQETDFEKFANNFSSQDWFYSTMYTMYQNKDILEANTEWQTASYKKPNNTYTTGTENYPVTSWLNSQPLCKYKLSTSGTEALVLCLNPFNIGYTKDTHNFKIQLNSTDYTFSLDTWGNYTTIMRIKL